jgi:hypothetical protein
MRKNQQLRYLFNGFRWLLKPAFWLEALPQHPVLGLKLMLLVPCLFCVDCYRLLLGQRLDA